MDRETRLRYLDNLRRKLFLKTEIKRILLNSIIQNRYLTPTYRYLALYNKTRLGRLNSKVQHKNRCVRSGRIWSVNHLTKYSRFIFRVESYHGHLPGFKRASW